MSSVRLVPLFGVLAFGALFCARLLGFWLLGAFLCAALVSSSVPYQEPISSQPTTCSTLVLAACTSSLEGSCVRVGSLFGGRWFSCLFGKLLADIVAADDVQASWSRIPFFLLVYYAIGAHLLLAMSMQFLPAYK